MRAFSAGLTRVQCAGGSRWVGRGGWETRWEEVGGGGWEEVGGGGWETRWVGVDSLTLGSGLGNLTMWEEVSGRAQR